MAYKFQIGPARLSGSSTFEEISTFEAGATFDGATAHTHISASNTLQVGGNATLGGTVTLNGVADTAVDVSADSLYFLDGDGAMKRDTVADIATAMAGTGIAAGSGQFALDISELSDAAVASGDKFLMLDSDGSAQQLESIDDIATFMAGTGIAAASGELSLDISELSDVAAASGDKFLMLDSDGSTEQLESVDDIATLFAGDGLAASSAVLSVQVSGAVVVASDKVGLSGSIAGQGLGYSGGVDSISGLAVNVDDSSIEISSDSLQIKALGVTNAMLSGGIANAKLVNSSVTVSAGNGLSGGGEVALGASTNFDLDISEFSDATPASGDKFLALDSDGSTEQLSTVDNLATLFAGDGLSAASAVMALDLNELTAAAVDVGNDSIALIDADDSNASRKESIADLVAAMAGSGLSAASGVMSVTSNNVALKADGDTLAEGYNYFATVSAAATVTLPASPTVGDTVIVKAKDGVSETNYIAINRAGSHTIDGETSVRIESPYGALSMVYVAANDWRIV